MSTKYLVVGAALAIMLIAATALATDNALQTRRRSYDKNQAIS